MIPLGAGTLISDLTEQIIDAGAMFPFVGFLVFTRAHADVVKMLRDPDYSAGLEEISGERLAVFVTVVLEGHSERGSPPPGAIGRIVPVWQEPSENMQLLSVFGLEKSRDAFLVLFDVETEHSASWRIDSSSAERAYESLRRGIELVVDSDTYEEARKRMAWRGAANLLSRVVPALAALRGATGQ